MNRPTRPSRYLCVGALFLATIAAGSIALGGEALATAKKTTKKTTTKTPTKTTTKAVAVSATTAPSTTTTAASTATTAKVTSGGATSASIVNVWKASAVDPTKLPIGDSKVSTSGAGVGTLFACSAGNPNAPGASADGPWLNIAAGTWDSTTKLAVEGKISWPTAEYSESVSNGKRVLVSNNLPVNYQSGTFPIASTDPSYAYDRNPGKITATAITRTLTATPTANASPTCMSEGAVGLLRNGVTVFNSLDGKGKDAVAHESQDLCQGHPAMTTYHYHNIPSCIRNATAGSSTVIGWILDGFPVVVERDAKGSLPSNADLDECHGRTSDIVIDGTTVNMYHYSATLEFPYFIGCYKGTPFNAR